MASESIGMITLLSVISVLLFVAIYAVSQFLRDAICARKHAAVTITRHWPATKPPARTGKPMSHQYQNLQGAQVRDLVTGLEGIVTAVMYCVNGCVRVCVQPIAKDNKPATDIEWCDVQQVRRIGAGVRQQLGIAGTDAEQPVDYPRTAAAGGPQKSSPRPT